MEHLPRRLHWSGKKNGESYEPRTLRCSHLAACTDQRRGSARESDRQQRFDLCPRTHDWNVSSRHKCAIARSPVKRRTASPKSASRTRLVDCRGRAYDELSGTRLTKTRHGPGTQPGPCAELAATEGFASVSWIERSHRRCRSHQSFACYSCFDRPEPCGSSNHQSKQWLLCQVDQLDRRQRRAPCWPQGR
jgi:hypothetical protein